MEALVRARFLASLCLLLSATAPAEPQKAASHSREFWREIAKNDAKLPEGESAAVLIQELSSYLGSPDPELRDSFGYEISAAWIYRDRSLGPEVLRGLLASWQKNLEAGVGQTGTDAVFLRSFSALNLSVLAALDNAAPFLSQEEFDSLHSAALAYLAAEKDTRGYDPVKGWIHPTAHTADLLKFLARSPRLKPGDQEAIARGLLSKVESSTTVFAFGEDERIARVFVSLLRRKDATPGLLDRWLEGLPKAQRALFATPRLDLPRYASVQNQKSVARCLFAFIAKDPASEAIDSARKALLGALSAL
ncbi:MAG: hypothetical protein DIJKHBIC_02202 [Thermoanaerobaculia bacterium]|nr:hypothetical protein [Thermoanaerobaculia bacterium]